jgi:hypothetical protein
MAQAFELKKPVITQASFVDVANKLTPGVHTFTLVVVDDDGNKSDPAKAVVTVRTSLTDPSPVITGPLTTGPSTTGPVITGPGIAGPVVIGPTIPSTPVSPRPGPSPGPLIPPLGPPKLPNT